LLFSMIISSCYSIKAPPNGNGTLEIDEIGTITSQPASPILPDNLKPPSNATFSFLLYASGKRTYICHSSSGLRYWDLVGIETYFINDVVKLYFVPAYQVVYHYLEDTPVSGGNLTWSAITKSDQSYVVGKSIAQSEDAADPVRKLPWELVQSTSNQEGGKLSNITYIVRVNTYAGIEPPANQCGVQYVSGKTLDVSYTADYWFYSGGKPQDPTNTTNPTAATATGSKSAGNTQIIYNNYLITFNFLMLFVITTLVIM